MPIEFTQSERFLSIKSELGEDILLLEEMHAKDGISELFELHCTVLSKEESIQPKDLIGTMVSIKMSLDDGEERFFSGYIKRLVGGHKNDRNLRVYHAEVVPWLWFLTKRQDCRIFQNKSVVDIISAVFDELGMQDYKTSGIKGTHEKRDYCVQYRESDFNFVSRLMEEEGIFYYWEHEERKHTLVLADDGSIHEPCIEKEIPFAPSSSEEHTIKSWEHQYQFRTGKWAQTDYNFTMPSNNLMTNTSTLLDLPNIDKYEVYDYPGSYKIKNRGADLTKLRMEEEEAEFDIVMATSGCRSLYAGGTFKIVDHELEDEDGGVYLITGITHEAVDATYGHEEGGAATVSYINRITCIPARSIFRPQYDSQRPAIHGTQTAVVVGPGGEEIYTDEYGRIKVQFHWDRQGGKDENSSCWVRVASTWAGKKWGMISIPRIGQEVVVTFLEGDPDRPLVIGSVYNAEQMPPYELPANKTQSGWKSRSSKGGSPDNFNEIRFEDKKGSEEVYIHAEKDQNTIVENDRNQHVGRDKSETVVRNKMIQVSGNHTEQITSQMNVTVGGSLTESVAVNYAETVGAAMELTVGGLLATSVGAAMTETVGGNRSETVGNNHSTEVGGNSSLKISKNLMENVKQNRDVNIEKDYKEKVGGQHKEEVTKEFMLDAKKISLTAKDEIEIKVGKASILMKKNGDITLKGNKINIKGSGDITMKGSKIKEN